MKKKKYSYVGRRFSNVVASEEPEKKIAKPIKRVDKKKDVVLEDDVTGSIPDSDLNNLNERGDYNE
jgi:hypothetical protein